MNVLNSKLNYYINNEFFKIYAPFFKYYHKKNEIHSMKDLIMELLYVFKKKLKNVDLKHFF